MSYEPETAAEAAAILQAGHDAALAVDLQDLEERKRVVLSWARGPGWRFAWAMETLRVLWAEKCLSWLTIHPPHERVLFRWMGKALEEIGQAVDREKQSP